MKTTSTRPFGSYYPSTLQGELKNRVDTAYQSLLSATNFDSLRDSAIKLSGILDQDIAAVRAMVGGGDSKYSYFRGSFLEELTILIAEKVVAEKKPEKLTELIDAIQTGIAAWVVKA